MTATLDSTNASATIQHRGHQKLNTSDHHTFCGLCEASCGLIATVTDGTLKGIRPDPNHPSSQGFACIKGTSFDQVITDPDRVIEPLRRAPDGTFRSATWEEALADIGRRLRRIKDLHGSQALGVAWGNPMAWNYSGYISALGMARALDSKHHYSSASIDINNYWVAADLMYGHPLVNLLPDFENADYALILGANPIISHGSMVTTGRIRSALQGIESRGGRVVVFDPRASETASLFTHVPIRPGSDPWLVAGILKVIIESDLQSDETLDAVTTGFDKLSRMLATMDADRITVETGISTATIQAVAHDLASADRAVVYGRCGPSLGRYSTLTKYLIDSLSIVTGNIDVRGGMIFGDPFLPFERVTRALGISGRNRWRTRVSKLPEVMGMAPLSVLPEEILTPGSGQLRGLVVCSANLATSAAGSGEVENALNALDLLVCIDPYVTETSTHADWILPPTLWLERDHLPLFTQLHSTTPNAQWAQPVTRPRGESRNDEWILRAICAEIGLTPSLIPGGQLLRKIGIAPSARTLANALLRMGKYGDHFGLRRSGLNRRRLQSFPGAIKLAQSCAVGVLHDKIHTSDGKIHFEHEEIAQEVRRLVDDSQEEFSQYPMRLFGIRELRSQNSWLHNVPRLMTGGRTCRVLINQADAARFRLEKFSAVRIESPWGSICSNFELTDDVIPGSVGMTQGWGHRGTWRLAATRSGANYNSLTPTAADMLDRPSGNAFFNGIPVRVEGIDRPPPDELSR